MKYSEAIRLGSMLYPQARGALCVEKAGGYAVCANGAAALALGCEIKELQPSLIVPERVFYAAPSFPGLFYEVMCMNDLRRMTREQIADWLVESGKDFEIELAPKVEKAAPEAQLCSTECNTPVFSE